MLDPKLTLNEAIELFNSFLFAKQDQIYEDPENDRNKSNQRNVWLNKPAQLRVSKLIDIQEYLNDAKDYTA